MSGFLAWLAESPLATAAKVAIAAVLAYVISSPEALGLSPIAGVAAAAAFPVLINWLNPEDTRYGNGAR